MQRFFNWLKAIFNRGMDKLEDPEVMIDQARRDMQQALASNNEKAVQAITERNRLKIMLDDNTLRSQSLEKQAVTSLKQGNREVARGLLREKANVDATIVTLQTTYDQASATVANVKTAIARQRDQVQQKLAESLALKAQWKQAQIQNSIAKALDGLTFENQFEGFGAAQERIRTAQSEAAARNEMYSESMAGKVASMEDATKDMEAESELQKLEERLGMREAAPAASEQAATVQSAGSEPATQSVGAGGAPAGAPAASDPGLQSEADRQLDELEKRLKGS